MAVLIIGIGGTGNEIIKRAKELLQINQAQMRFYYIDSDEQEVNKYSDEEATNVGGFLVSNAVENQWGTIQSWWYPKNFKPDYISEIGTGKNRHIGRLNLFMNAGKIQDDLTRIFNRFTGPAISIYIICSLGGGQGSSICVDVAMLCQKVLKEQGKVFGIAGVFLDAGVVYSLVDNNEDSILTGLATITEMEYYNLLNLRSSLKKYEFKPLELTEPIASSDPPFNLAFLIQHKNKVNQNFESRDDYYDLMAFGLVDLIHISNNLDQVQNFPGKITASTGYEDFFRRWIDKGNLDQFSTKWGSFGVVDVQLPIEKISQYCLKRLSHETVNILLQPVQEEEIKTINVFLENLFNSKGLWESNEKEQIQKKVLKVLGKKDANLFLDRSSLVNKLAQALHIAGENFPKTLETRRQSLENQISMYENNHKILETEELKNFGDSVVSSLIAEKTNLVNKGKIGAAREFLSTFNRKIQNEINDLLENEQAWLNKANEKSIIQTINAKVVEIRNKKKKFIEHIKKDAVFQNRLKPKKAELARYWVDFYYRYRFLKVFLEDIRLFYANLQDIIRKELEVLQNLEKELTQIQNKYNYEGILSSSIDIVGRKSGHTDFCLSVCSSEEIVSNMIYSTLDSTKMFKSLISKGIDKFTTNIDSEIEEEVKNKVSDKLNLEIGLEYEAKYFCSELKKKFSDLPLYKLKLERETYSKWIGTEAFDFVYNSCLEEKHGKPYREQDVNIEIIKGRLKTLFDKFAFPFWSLDKAELRHSITEDKYKLLSFHTNLGKLKEIVFSIYQSCPIFNDNNPYHLRLFTVEGGMPIYIMNQITCYYDFETKRRGYFLKEGKMLSADSHGTNKSCYNDRLFIDDKERNQFSIFIEEEKEEIHKYFALAEFFGFITTARENIRRNFKLNTEFGVKYPSGTALGPGIEDAMNTILNDSNLFSLLKVKLNKALHEAEVRDPDYLKANIKSHYTKYGTILREQTPKIKDVYKKLRKSLVSYF